METEIKSYAIKRQVFESPDDWKEFRKGLFTASNINKLTKCRRGSTDFGDVAISYIMETIGNTIAEPKLEYYSSAMEWGNEQEPFAVLRLCEELNLDPDSPHVIYTSQNGIVFFSCEEYNCGGTPDLIFHDSIGEIKCPNSDTHLYYKLYVNAENFADELPEYYDQIQLNLWLTQRDYCHFYSFDPRFKKHSQQTHRVIVKRDNERIAYLLERCARAKALREGALSVL